MELDACCGDSHYVLGYLQPDHTRILLVVGDSEIGRGQHLPCRVQLDGKTLQPCHSCTLASVSAGRINPTPFFLINLLLNSFTTEGR